VISVSVSDAAGASLWITIRRGKQEQLKAKIENWILVHPAPVGKPFDVNAGE
jgi:hypothetical protein